MVDSLKAFRLAIKEGSIFNRNRSLFNTQRKYIDKIRFEDRTYLPISSDLETYIENELDDLFTNLNLTDTQKLILKSIRTQYKNKPYRENAENTRNLTAFAINLWGGIEPIDSKQTYDYSTGYNLNVYGLMKIYFNSFSIALARTLWNIFCCCPIGPIHDDYDENQFIYTLCHDELSGSEILRKKNILIHFGESLAAYETTSAEQVQALVDESDADLTSQQNQNDFLSRLKYMRYGFTDYGNTESLITYKIKLTHILHQKKNWLTNEEDYLALFLQCHRLLLDKDRGTFFGGFKKTNIESLQTLPELLKHAKENNNRSRQVFIKLGWLDDCGEVTSSTPQLIKDCCQGVNKLAQTAMVK